MTKSEFMVEFITGVKERVWAFNADDAKIIAQGRQIEKGNDRNVKDILVKLNDGTWSPCKLE